MPKPDEDQLALFIDSHRVIKRTEIQRLLSISRSTLWRRIKSGQFPPPAFTQNGRSYWLFKDVLQWLSDH
ncbi:MAG: helix-turn-helix transcriptional regulator [Shewanella sp.]